MEKERLKELFHAVAPYGAGLAAAGVGASLVPSPTLVVVWATAGYIGAQAWLAQRQARPGPQIRSP
ncbi:MAG TPA: hypothetical protein PKX87_03280 [Alphaproteobacteria bacterium]|nr:hypothetical protein [Alphaproteobacteria bacterium]